MLSIFDKLFTFIKYKIDKLIEKSNKTTFGDMDDKIIDYNKLRFSSDVYLPIDTAIKFHALTIVISYIIKKGDKYYPEIYLT